MRCHFLKLKLNVGLLLELALCRFLASSLAEWFVFWTPFLTSDHLLDLFKPPTNAGVVVVRLILNPSAATISDTRLINLIPIPIP